MDNTKQWDMNRASIRSKKGKWNPGEGVSVGGYSLFDDLFGKSSYFQIVFLHVCGWIPERRVADWVEACFVMLSWPDVRLWPNRIGAIAATVRATPVAGIALGALAADSRIYGPGTAVMSVEFLKDAMREHRSGKSAKEIVEAKRNPQTGKILAPGYIRPLMSGDERVPYLQSYAKQLGLEAGEHLELAYEIDDYLRDTYSEGINFAGYMAAVCLDLGLTPEQSYRVFSMCVAGGVHATYSEWADEPPETFLPLRCDDIDYTGPSPREVG